MSGFVNASMEAVLPVEFRSGAGEPETISAVLDTGFTGFLTLPAAAVGSLSLPLLGSAPVILADGSVVTLDVYETLVVWHGRPRLVECLVAEGASLIGMNLLRGSELRVEAEPGGAVAVSPLD